MVKFKEKKNRKLISLLLQAEAGYLLIKRDIILIFIDINVLYFRMR